MRRVVWLGVGLAVFYIAGAVVDAINALTVRWVKGDVSASPWFGTNWTFLYHQVYLVVLMLVAIHIVLYAAVAAGYEQRLHPQQALLFLWGLLPILSTVWDMVFGALVVGSPIWHQDIAYWYTLWDPIGWKLIRVPIPAWFVIPSYAIRICVGLLLLHVYQYARSNGITSVRGAILGYVKRYIHRLK